MKEDKLSQHEILYKLIAWVDLFKYECSHSDQVNWEDKDEQAYQYLKSILQKPTDDVYEYALGILNKIDFEGLSLQEKVNLLVRSLLPGQKPTESRIEGEEHVAVFPGVGAVKVKGKKSRILDAKEMEWLKIWRSNCLEAHKEHEPISDCENCHLYTDCKKAYDKLRRE